MQINQQICRTMEELEKMEEDSPDDSEVCKHVHSTYLFQETNIRSTLQQRGKEMENEGIKNNIRIRIIQLYSKLD